jgi:hypothetical protein
MLQTAILYPVFIQVLLTFFVLIAMGHARNRSLKESGLTTSDAKVALGRNTWSDQALKVSNNYKNQFELPVLFYALAAFAIITRSVDYLMVVLAWVFVISRVIHAGVHIGPNVLRWRGLAFAVGAIVLLAMWLMLAARLITGV